MKSIGTLLLCVYSLVIHAQLLRINNGSFENWSQGLPDSWGTFTNVFPNSKHLATLDSTTRVHGKYSAVISTDTLFLINTTVVLPGILNYGSIVYQQQPGGGGIKIYGTPFKARPDSLRMALRYQPTGNDTAFVQCQFSLRTTYIGGIGNTVQDNFLLPQNTNGWQYFAWPLVYSSDSVPDTLRLSLLPSYRTPQVGSRLWVDSIYFVYKLANGVAEIQPNNLLTILQYENESLIQINSDEVCTLRIVTSDGRLHSEIICAQDKTISTRNWPRGTYMTTLFNNQRAALVTARLIIW